ncbi:MAG: nucleoside recognition domain-containing protein [Symbiobacterium sp.]|jgi:Nucleoside recognition.|uniref:nucleoside recognition domain-containing protein n=1 Tax=Symbiobacterium sp. TaxID=1971213 RepID=UPI0034638A08
MVWLTWIWEGLVAGVLGVVKLWWLLLLFVAIQLLKDSGWLPRVARHAVPALRPLRLPADAAVPMVAGLGIGLTYGAGVLLQTAREGRLSRNELTVMCVFLGVCHAIVEETVLFTAVGASGLLLLAVRFSAACVAGWLAARAWLPRLADVEPVSEPAPGRAQAR